MRPWPSPRAAACIQDSLLEPLDQDGRAALERLGADRRGLALHLREREEVEGRGGEVTPPRNVSVGGVIDYTRCPKRFYWTSVRPLPRFSGPAARIGTEVHRWIERRSSGQGQLLELDDAPDLTADELATEPGKVDRLRQAFLASRFAGVVPLFAERAFLFRLDGFAVSGRIDAVFGASVEGPWEVVDWKTGRRPAGRRPARRPAARPLRPGLRRGVGQARRGPHAHLSLSGRRRRGLTSDGRSRRGASPRRGTRSVRSGRERSIPRRVRGAITATSCPSVIPDAAGWPPTTECSEPSGQDSRRSICSENRR